MFNDFEVEEHKELPFPTESNKLFVNTYYTIVNEIIDSLISELGLLLMQIAVLFLSHRGTIVLDFMIMVFGEESSTEDMSGWPATSQHRQDHVHTCPHCHIK